MHSLCTLRLYLIECVQKNRVLPRLAGIHVQGIRGYGVAGISGYGCILCILFIRCVFDRVCEKPG